VAAAKRILVVEDNDDLRTLFRIALTLDGFAVLEARTGLEALRIFESTAPDLVVLDLGLPGIDGFAVQQELSAQAGNPPTPIVIVTGSPRDVAGPNVACVLRKPVSPTELVATVRTCLAAGSPPAGS
jgi:two-component system OmpR family response regulator